MATAKKTTKTTQTEKTEITEEQARLPLSEQGRQDGDSQYEPVASHTFNHDAEDIDRALTEHVGVYKVNVPKGFKPRWEYSTAPTEAKRVISFHHDVNEENTRIVTPKIMIRNVENADHFVATVAATTLAVFLAARDVPTLHKEDGRIAKTGRFGKHMVEEMRRLGVVASPSEGDGKSWAHMAIMTPEVFKQEQAKTPDTKMLHLGALILEIPAIKAAHGKVKDQLNRFTYEPAIAKERAIRREIPKGQSQWRIEDVETGRVLTIVKGEGLKFNKVNDKKIRIVQIEAKREDSATDEDSADLVALAGEDALDDLAAASDI